MNKTLPAETRQDFEIFFDHLVAEIERSFTVIHSVKYLK